MLQISAASAWWFLPLATPIALWAAWSDMKFMTIPNKAVGALLAGFAVIGLIALPLPEYLWRYSHFALILALGFVANMAGLIGAGDAKFAAAIAPLVAPGDAGVMMYLLAAVLLGAFATHRLFRAIPAVRAHTGDWVSWQQRDFPMGLALGGALIFYLALGAFAGV